MITMRDWALAGGIVAKMSLGDVFVKKMKAKIESAEKATNNGNRVKALKVRKFVCQTQRLLISFPTIHSYN